MKTKNNVQKAVTKTFAVVISLVLISITVNAQDFWRSVLKNSSFNAIASAMVDHYPNVNNDEADVAVTGSVTKFESETENPLELESWMTDDSNFSTSFNFKTETESPLQLEDWMTNENTFTTKIFSEEVEKEEPLVLEDWMLVDFLNNIVEKEQPLELESWMIAFDNPVR